MREVLLAGDTRKLALHPEISQARPTPVTVQLSPTGRCNLACRWCTRGRDPGRESLTAADLAQILSILKRMGTRGIEVTGGGEPLLHRDVPAFMGEALASGIDVALVTNGTRLHKLPLGLLGALDWIRVSLNAGPKTYQEVHGVDLYQQVVNNVHILRDCAHPNRGVSIIFDEKTDWEDIQTLLNDLDGARLDYVRFARDGKKLDLPWPFEVEELRMPADARGLLLERFRRVDAGPRCLIGYYKPTISHNGLIYRCCAEFNAEDNPQGHYADMPKIWNDRALDQDTTRCWGYPCIYAVYNEFIVDCWTRHVRNPNFI